MQFTEDWTTARVQFWPVAELVGQPAVYAVEIGVFEGRTSRWLLENVLTGPDCRLFCVDPFAGLTHYGDKDAGDYYARFCENIAPFGDRVCVLKGDSQLVLRDQLVQHLAYGQAALVYVDGDHRAAEVLEDAVLAWRFLRPGGILIFDDYGWEVPGNALEEPALAVDVFLRVYAMRLTVVHRGWQVIVRKV
jgi:predicted O-methyltransferase YrrM